MNDEVLFSREGHLGVITLNRPTALNALTLPMIFAIQEQLCSWQINPDIGALVIRAVPGNAFCAGGDVRWLYQTGKANITAALQFFWHEYRLNHFIHHLGKPFIALMDGITMGGGVGVSLHGTHPVATDRFVFAMPETSIGFFPDIGASYLLNRCPGALGVYLGLTGNRLNAEQAVDAGLAKARISSESLESLFGALSELDLSHDADGRITQCIESYAMPVDTHVDYSLINECYAKPTVEEIIEVLAIKDTAMSHALVHKSPLSLKITLEQLRRTRGLSLSQCLKIDYTMVQHFMQGHDFYEGVRALLVDKDKNPQWKPKTLDGVEKGLVDGYFESIGRELEFLV